MVTADKKIKPRLLAKRYFNRIGIAIDLRDLMYQVKAVVGGHVVPRSL